MPALDRTGQSTVQTVPACPVQIRAHHHTDVYTDINDWLVSKLVEFTAQCNRDFHIGLNSGDDQKFCKLDS